MSDFSVHRIIGRGGFGEVFGCRKVDTGKMYAMKCLGLIHKSYYSWTPVTVGPQLELDPGCRWAPFIVGPVDRIESGIINQFLKI